MHPTPEIEPLCCVACRAAGGATQPQGARAKREGAFFLVEVAKEGGGQKVGGETGASEPRATLPPSLDCRQC